MAVGTGRGGEEMAAGSNRTVILAAHRHFLYRLGLCGSVSLLFVSIILSHVRQFY
jgi:hypothetical protein